jgi:TIGR03009 family protein
MRRHLYALALALAAGAAASAQTASTTKTPERKPPTPVTAANLDKYLKSWETEMTKVTSLSATINRADKDKTFGTTSRYSGKAMYMKSGSGDNVLNLGLLELSPEGKTEIAEKVVCTGTFLYQFAPAQKEVRAYEVPRGKKTGVGEDSFLSLLFGMKADQAKKRYELKADEDAHYIYVHVTPRFRDDKAEFEKARLVLLKKNYMPRQLWFQHVNGSQVTWDIPKLETGVNLDRRYFDAPKAPPGWKLVSVNTKAGTTNPPPRVIRQNGK